MVIFNSTNKHIFLPKALKSQKLKLKPQSTKQRYYLKSLQIFKKNHIKIMVVAYGSCLQISHYTMFTLIFATSRSNLSHIKMKAWQNIYKK